MWTNRDAQRVLKLFWLYHRKWELWMWCMQQLGLVSTLSKIMRIIYSQTRLRNNEYMQWWKMARIDGWCKFYSYIIMSENCACGSWRDGGCVWINNIATKIDFHRFYRAKVKNAFHKSVARAYNHIDMTSMQLMSHGMDANKLLVTYLISTVKIVYHILLCT